MHSDGAIRGDAAAEYTTYAYDDQGRQSTVSEYTGNTTAPTLTSQTRYTYDPLTGNIATIASPQGTITYSYDPATGEHIQCHRARKTGH